MFTEESLVEDYIVDHLKSQGWTFVSSSDLERESYEEPLLTPVLVRKIMEINKEKRIGPGEIRDALNQLKLKSTGYDGAKQILNFFKFGIPVKFEEERVVKYINIFDFNNPQNNNFIVSRQVHHKKSDREIRNDIILYINGIPIVNIECKSPVNFSEDWYSAYLQIKNYEKEMPELYKYVQIGIGAEQVAKYFPIIPWIEDVHIQEWKVKNKDSMDSTIEMLNPQNLLNILKNYLLFRLEYGKATKVITRYMQFRASEKIYQRIVNNIKGETKKDKGLIWHWQGSGKTLTMIFAGNKVYQDPLLENPTIFFVVDREELEEQLRLEFNALDISKAEVITSISHLKQVIKHDSWKGKRGVFIILIHKFRPDELKTLYEALEEKSKKNETLLTRRNVVAFIDEGHRTQYGTLAGQMKRILKNAFRFSFTGTPIAIQQRNTYAEFAYPPEEIYLDRYFITDSIRDEFTVKIAYQPKLEKEPGISLDKSLLDSFIEGEFEEIPEEFRGRITRRIKEKLNTLRIVLENEARIYRISSDIAEHFKKNVDDKYKAIVVAVSRKACALYKKALDSVLPAEYSEVVMSHNHREKDDVIREISLDLQRRYDGKDFDDIKKEIIEKFKDERSPKILIVTDMLLAGFDAPILQTMYLDKPLKGHRLLQTIARTNRPYKGVKEAGQIIDYVGVLKELNNAFASYSSEDIAGILHKTRDLTSEFSQLLVKILRIFEDVPKDQYDRQTMIKALEILTRDDNTAKEFTEDYKKLRNLFEILGSEEIKIILLNGYKWITAVHIYYTTWVKGQTGNREKQLVEKYFKKTIECIHDSTEIQNLEQDLPVFTFDEDYLKKLSEVSQTEAESAANIVFMLNKFVLVEQHRNPVYESLTDRVERILKKWKQTMKDYREIYKEGVEVFKAIQELQARQREIGFSDFEYSMLILLENRFTKQQELVDDITTLSKRISAQMFPGWFLQKTARKNVEQEIRRFLRKYIKEYGISMKDLEEIFQEILDCVKNYGYNG